MDEDEQRAVERMRQGDIGGLALVVDRYQLQAVRAAYLITRDRALAEDVAQTVFVRVYERITQFDSCRPIAPWLMRCVVHEAIKVAKRAHRTVPFGDDDHETGDGLPADAVELMAQADAVWVALATLSPEQRAVVVRRYYLGMREVEIAADLDCPPGTIRWRLHAAHGRLRKILWAWWHGEEHVDDVHPLSVKEVPHGR